MTSAGRLRIAALVLPVLGGCALVLGFEDTTLRTGDGGASDDADLGIDGASLDGAPSRLSTEPTSIVVRRGTTTQVKVTLDRGSDVSGAVTAKLDELPMGVTSAPATIAEGSTSTTLDVVAAADAPYGSSNVELSVDVPGLPPLSLSLLVAGVAGAIDTSFDGDGFIADATRGAIATFYALAIQPDGKIVAAGVGTAGVGNQTGWFVKRFNVDATPDATFTTNAAAAVPVNGNARAIAIDAQGKIVLCGTSGTGAGAQLTLVRLDAEGKIDPTFATGTVKLVAGDAPLGSTGAGVAIAPNGDIVAVGTRAELQDSTGVVMRFKANGTRDPTFNGGAVLLVPKARLFSAAIEAQGAIITGGTNNAGAATSYVVTKRLPTGAADQTFGAAGVANFGAGLRARAFVRLPDGTFFLAGDATQPANQYSAGLTNAAGAQIFARAIGPGANAGYFAAAPGGEGRILVAGHTGPPNGEARVDRLFPDAGRDTSFGTQGTAVIEPGGLANGFDVTLFALGSQTDGRILVAGNKTNAGAVIYRLWP